MIGCFGETNRPVQFVVIILGDSAFGVLVIRGGGSEGKGKEEREEEGGEFHLGFWSPNWRRGGVKRNGCAGVDLSSGE